MGVLVKTYHSYIDTALLNSAIDEVPQLLNNADAEIIQRTLTLVTSIALHKGEALADVHQAIASKYANFMRLSLLQDTTNPRLFEAMAQSKLPGHGARQLFDKLRSLASDESQHFDDKV